MGARDKRQPDRAILIPLSSNSYESDDGTLRDVRPNDKCLKSLCSLAIQQNRIAE